MDRQSTPLTTELGTSTNFKSLRASGTDRGPTRLRLLVDNKHIKHVTVDPGVYDSDHLTCKSFVPQLLPIPPIGEWRTARIRRNLGNGEAGYTDLDFEIFPSNQDVWHPTKIDFFDLDLNYFPGQRDVYPATWKGHEGPYVAKICDFSWYMPKLEQETTAYRLLQAHSIGPKFFGHITEHGRVVGFLLERIEGRYAKIEDLALVQAEVKRLHRAGLLHGDINKHNVVIKGDSAVLIDFSELRSCENEEEFEAEFAEIEPALLDRSGLGGRVYRNVREENKHLSQQTDPFGREVIIEYAEISSGSDRDSK